MYILYIYIYVYKRNRLDFCLHIVSILGCSVRWPTAFNSNHLLLLANKTFQTCNAKYMQNFWAMSFCIPYFNFKNFIYLPE